MFVRVPIIKFVHAKYCVQSPTIGIAGKSKGCGPDRLNNRPKFASEFTELTLLSQIGSIFSNSFLVGFLPVTIRVLLYQSVFN